MSDIEQIIHAHAQLKKTCQSVLSLAESKRWDEVIALQGSLGESLSEWIELNDAVPMTEETSDQRLKLLHSVMGYQKKISALLMVRRDEIGELLMAADRQKAGAGFGAQIDSATYEQPGKRRRS